jgi:hypothetical protein
MSYSKTHRRRPKHKTQELQKKDYGVCGHRRLDKTQLHHRDIVQQDPTGQEGNEKRELACKTFLSHLDVRGRHFDWRRSKKVGRCSGVNTLNAIENKRPLQKEKVILEQ